MSAGPKPRTLSGLVFWRIVLFALVATFVQCAWTAWRYARAPEDLADDLIDRDIAQLSAGLSVKDGALLFSPPASKAARYADGRGGYVLRVRAADGATVYANCDEPCVERAFPKDAGLGRNAVSWTRRTSEGFPLTVAGGHQVSVGDVRAYVEVAILGDQRSGVITVFLDELVEEVLLPTGIILALALGASTIAIGRSLAPVKRAAATAARLDPLRPDTVIDDSGMPLEVAQLVRAVNRSYERVRELMSGQRVFTAAISHEIRTPLAVVRLEMEAIDHPRARRAIREIDELIDFVQQLTALARLEASELRPAAALDLDALLSDVVASIAPWIYDHGATIALVAESGARVQGDEALIKNAARNLIENAVRHGGRGVAVTVRSGPGPVVAVEDDGADGPKSADAQPDRDGGRGVGLEIVRRIAALQGAAFEIAPADPHGMRASLRFRTADGPAAG